MEITIIMSCICVQITTKACVCVWCVCADYQYNDVCLHVDYYYNGVCLCGDDHYNVVYLCADYHKSSLTTCSFSPDDSRVITTSTDRTAKFYDLHSQTCTIKLEYVDNSCFCQVLCMPINKNVIYGQWKNETSIQKSTALNCLFLFFINVTCSDYSDFILTASTGKPKGKRFLK